MKPRLLIFLLPALAGLYQCSQPAPEPVFGAQKGIISIEAEHFLSATGWKVQDYYTGIGIVPDTESSATDSANYLIDIPRPGTYSLFLLGSRRSGNPTGENAIKLKLVELQNHDAKEVSVQFPSLTAPIWFSAIPGDSGKTIHLKLQDKGRFRLTVQRLKGDGMYLDKLILSDDPGFQPSGFGPVETLKDSTEEVRNQIVVPPDWAFGVLYGGYTDQVESLAVIDTLIQGDFPIDAYWIDSYFWNFKEGEGPKGYIDFIGDTIAFPNAGDMWDSFEQNHIKAGIWIWNMILKTGNEAAYNDFRTRGFFTDTFRYTNGWHNEGGNTMAGSVAFDNPAAADYWKQKLDPFFKEGLDFLKLDNSSAIPFCKAAFEATQELGLETRGRGFILAHLHTTYDYRHKLYPAKWTGDAKIAWTQPDYPDNSVYAMGGLKENIQMIADPRRTTYEIPFLSHDAGGYNYFGSTDQSDELYMRWIEFSSMNSIMMFFSHATNLTRNHPYRYSPESQGVFRKYTHLRMRLFPYRYTYALRSHLTGEKMIRGDRKTGLQFMVGDELLVAPVYEKGAVARKILLPEGSWIDPETDEIYEGGREIIMDAPVTKLPMLVKEGAIIPKRNYARSVEMGSNDTLTLEIYPSREKTEFVLLEDDGRSNDYLTGGIASTRFTVHNSGLELEFRIHPVEGTFKDMSPERYYILRFHKIDEPKAVKVNGEEQEFQFTGTNGLKTAVLEMKAGKADLQTVKLTF